MNRISLADGFAMVLDYCLAHGVWFDAQELGVAKAWLSTSGIDGNEVVWLDDDGLAQLGSIAVHLERLFGKPEAEA
jgi:hypothetical protein